MVKRRERNLLYNKFEKGQRVRIKPWNYIEKWISNSGKDVDLTVGAIDAFMRGAGSYCEIVAKYYHCCCLSIDNYCWAYEWLETMEEDCLPKELFEI